MISRHHFLKCAFGSFTFDLLAFVRDWQLVGCGRRTVQWQPRSGFRFLCSDGCRARLSPGMSPPSWQDENGDACLLFKSVTKPFPGFEVKQLRFTIQRERVVFGTPAPNRETAGHIWTLRFLPGRVWGPAVGRGVPGGPRFPLLAMLASLRSLSRWAWKHRPFAPVVRQPSGSFLPLDKARLPVPWWQWSGTVFPTGHRSRWFFKSRTGVCGTRHDWRFQCKLRSRRNSELKSLCP